MLQKSRLSVPVEFERGRKEDGGWTEREDKNRSLGPLWVLSAGTGSHDLWVTDLMGEEPVYGDMRHPCV